MFQRQLRSLEPLVVRLRPPRDHFSALRRSSRKISDAFGGHSRNYGWNTRCAAAWRRAPGSCHGSWLHGVRPRLAGGLLVVLAGRKEDFSARRVGTWDRRIAVTVPDEGLTCNPWPLFAHRMDCTRHLACSRLHPPSPPPLRRGVESSFCLASSDSNAWALVASPLGTTLAPTKKLVTSKCVSM